MQNGAQCRSLVYSSGQWCTTWSCTVELVHNVCLTNPEGRTDATKCITSPSLQSINIDLKSYSSKEGPSQSSYRIGRSAHFKCKFNSDLFHRQGLSIYLDYKTTYIIKNWWSYNCNRRMFCCEGTQVVWVDITICPFISFSDLSRKSFATFSL